MNLYCLNVFILEYYVSYYVLLTIMQCLKKQLKAGRFTLAHNFWGCPQCRFTARHDFVVKACTREKCFTLRSGSKKEKGPGSYNGHLQEYGTNNISSQEAHCLKFPPFPKGSMLSTKHPICVKGAYIRSTNSRKFSSSLFIDLEW